MTNTTGEPFYDVRSAQRRLLRMHFESGVGHIGGNLSCLDALLVTFHQYLRSDDHFVLSKGHSAGALYTTLWTMNELTDADLATFHKDDTLLAGHPPARGIPRIQFATGSLGHGSSLAAGLALGARLTNSGARVVCVTSDGEWQEGSTWEALVFAAHHVLDNLTILVDHNGLQGFGSTSAVASMSPLADRLSGFDIDIEVVDGHNHDAILAALERPGRTVKVVILETVKGHGVSFMEDRMEWHYLPLTAALFELAEAEISAR